MKFILVSVGVTSIIFAFCLTSCNGIQAEKDLVLTASEKSVLEEFSKRMQPYLLRDYMKADLYLVRWLRVNHFNLDKAEYALLANLDWRDKLDMDNILEENWGDYHERYRFWRHGVDREGQPIAYLDLGSWDMRKAVDPAERRKIVRYLAYAMETMVTKVRNLQAEGKNVTRYMVFGDLTNFNIAQQGCLHCFPIYIEYVSMWQERYPLTIDKIVFVNTPPVFEVVLRILRPLMTKSTRDALEIYGRNKSAWLRVVNNYAKKSQLPPELGGTDYTKYDDSYR